MTGTLARRIAARAYAIFGPVFGPDFDLCMSELPTIFLLGGGFSYLVLYSLQKILKWRKSCSKI